MMLLEPIVFKLLPQLNVGFIMFMFLSLLSYVFVCYLLF